MKLKLPETKQEMWEENVGDSHSLGIPSTGNMPCWIVIDVLQDSISFKYCLYLANPTEGK